MKKLGNNINCYNIKIIIVLLFFSIIKLYSQEHKLISYGLITDFNYNNDIADFHRLPGVPNCCQKFEYGEGAGFTFGAMSAMPLSDFASELLKVNVKGLNGQLRLSYSSLSNTLKATETTTVWDSKNDIPVKGEFEHSIKSKLSVLYIEPMLTYLVYDKISFNLGFQAGILLQKSYEQKEQITQPSDGGTFLDVNGVDTHKYTRNEYNGTLPEANIFQASISGGFSYELPLNKKGDLFAMPEIIYSYAFTNVVSGLPWSANALRIGVTFKYSPLYIPPPLPPVEEHKERKMIDTATIVNNDIAKDTVLIGKSTFTVDTSRAGNVITITETYKRRDTLLKAVFPELLADINAYGIDDDGASYPLDLVKVEQFISQKTSPLLNYVFFDENSYEIPKRYNQLTEDKTNTFYEEKLYKDDNIQFYYNLLNIVGRRLIQFPKSTITLTAINPDMGSEKNNHKLFNNRIESIKNYFVNVWGISEKRIKKHTQNTQSSSSSTVSIREISEEMRRVEITSDNWEVVKPVFSTDTIWKSNYQAIKFQQSVKSGAGISDWAMKVKQNNKILFSGEGKNNFKDSLEWKFSDLLAFDTTGSKPIEYDLSVTNKKHQSALSPIKSVPFRFTSIIEKQVEKKEDIIIGRYSLILFDFNKSELTSHNKKIIELIKSRIQPNSKIFITGYTDAIGEEDYNYALSQARADATALALNSEDVKEVKGVGKSKLLYDISTPEGRFYCRTVEIVIETKIQN